jgi:hypothetical protein
MDGYEMVREPEELSENAEYILVTDDPTLKSDKWTIKLIPEWLKEADGFTKSFYIRYHPFEFVNTNTCIVLDGSIHIKKSLDKLITDFYDSGKDCMFMVHWCLDNIMQEYPVWVNQRGYPAKQANKVFAFFVACGYLKTYKGAFEAGFKIVKNCDSVNKLHNFVYTSLELLGDKLHVDRVDQGILTAIMNTKFTDIAMMPCTHQIIQNDYMTYYHHNTWDAYPVPIKKNLFLFNEPVNVYYLK